MCRSYNHRVKPWIFQVGELVLKENPHNQADPEKKGKFEPNWLGPFVITTVFGSGAYQLSTQDGDQLEEPINSMHLKKFYVWKIKNSEKSEKINNIEKAENPKKIQIWEKVQ